MKQFLKYSENLLSLFYPKVCYACAASISGNEEILCTYCRLSLPETNYHTAKNNPIEQIFWGRIPVVQATAFLFFEKGSRYRHLLHEFKYNGKREIGTILGRLMGSALLHCGFKKVDIVVPVPLHPVKFRRRGFNQSEIIARGIATVLDKPVFTDVLVRSSFSSTQTRKSRFDRWKNVEGIFRLAKPYRVENKHILLIDDVITTGATLEAAGNSLLTADSTKISIAALAYALQ